MRGRRLGLTVALFSVLAGVVTFLWAQTALGDEEPMAVSLNVPTVGPGTPTHTPTPTSQPPSFITNDSGQTAAFVYVTGTGALSGVTPPGDCGTPVYEERQAVNNPPDSFNGWAFVEELWAAPCVDPQISEGVGEKVSLHWLFHPITLVHSQAFRPALVTETFSYNGPNPANQLNVVPAAGSLGEPFIVDQPAACPTPTFQFEPLLGEGDIDIIWRTACIQPGDEVTVHLVGAEPSDTTPHSWSLDPEVGGVAELPGEPAASSPAQTTSSGGDGMAIALGIVAAAVVGLAGAAWALRRGRSA